MKNLYFTDNMGKRVQQFKNKTKRFLFQLLVSAGIGAVGGIPAISFVQALSDAEAGRMLTSLTVTKGQQIGTSLKVKTKFTSQEKRILQKQADAYVEQLKKKVGKSFDKRIRKNYRKKVIGGAIAGPFLLFGGGKTLRAARNALRRKRK
jgi:hypothetical protein